jgi:hypothetical protein
MEIHTKPEVLKRAKEIKAEYEKVHSLKTVLRVNC